MRARSYLLSLSVLAAISLLVLLPIPPMDAEDSLLETSVVGGYVFDRTTAAPLANFTVRIERDYFIGRETTTGPDGYYRFNLSSGSYRILVFSDDGQLRLEDHFDVSMDQGLRMDLPVDRDVVVLSTFHGTVRDRDGERVEDATVRVHRERPLLTNSTRTSEEGHYSILLPPGDYIVEVFYDGDQEFNGTASISWGEDLEMNLSLERVSVERPLITPDDVGDFFIRNWLNLVVLIVIINLLFIAYMVFLSAQRRFRKRRSMFLETEWFRSGRRLFQRVLVIVAVTVLVMQVSAMSVVVKDNVWSWFKDIVVPLLSMVIVLFLTRIALFWTARFWDYISSRKNDKGESLIPQQFVSLLEPISRYLILFISAVIIFLLVLYAVGLREQISDSFGDFFGKNAGKMFFLVILIIMAVFLKRFIDTFFKEVGSKAKKVSPQMLDMSRRGTFGITYFALALIFMFTLLSIAGLGDIGSTFILVISMIVGFVVSFAATGSIGNMLSGLVLISMKPFEVGDRVQLGDGLIGDVENIGIMFTRIKDLESRLIEIPNNNILQNNLANLSVSARSGGFALAVDCALGYDIDPKKARKLMVKASLATPGILKRPAPQVIVRSFMNHYVEYRLRAYTDEPKNMASIRSTVMENMIDMFRSEGLDIMSPTTVFELHTEDSSARLPYRIGGRASDKEAPVSFPAEGPYKGD